MQLWLVRHGQTDWNVEGRYQGQTDVPLNAAGRAQAAALAQTLTGQKFAALYSSDLQRAQTTAAILGAHLGLSMQIEPRLREINQGEWEGQLAVELAERFQTLWRERLADAHSVRPPGGESVAELAARVSAAANEIAQAHPGENVLIVSHGLAIAVLLCLGRRLPLTMAYQLVPDNSRATGLEWPPALS